MKKLLALIKKLLGSLGLVKKEKGFTLVELMIVITVIAILITIAVASFTRVQKQARDAKRKGDLKALTTALQAYYTENMVYPTVTAEADASTALTALVPNYIPAMPEAPKGVTGGYATYKYNSDTDGYKYALCVGLEAMATSSGIWVVNTQNSGGYVNATCDVL